MKESLEPVFRCDHCNKAMRNKGAMSLHERMCKSNPKNDHKCFQYCRFLVKDRDDSNGETYFDCINKDCDMSNKDLYSYKLERFYFNKDRISKMTRMPLQCDYYRIENGHDIAFENDLFR